MTDRDDPCPRGSILDPSELAPHMIDSEEGSSGDRYDYCTKCGEIWTDETP